MSKFFFFLVMIRIYFSKKIYVSSETDSNCAKSNNCDGSIYKPFVNLINAFNFVEKQVNISPTLFQETEITLISGFYIINQKHFAPYTKSPLLKKFVLFENISKKFKLSILPIGCENITEICTKIPEISIRTDEFTFSINFNFSIKNINFTGVNLLIDNRNEACMNEKQGCCSYKSLIVYNSFGNCSLISMKIKRMDIEYQSKIGLFHFKKSLKNQIEFFLINCSFELIYSFGKNKFISLIQLVNDNNVNNFINLKIAKCKFKNFYLDDGILLITPKKSNYIKIIIEFSFINYFNRFEKLSYLILRFSKDFEDKSLFKIQNANFTFKKNKIENGGFLKGSIFNLGINISSFFCFNEYKNNKKFIYLSHEKFQFFYLNYSISIIEQEKYLNNYLSSGSHIFKLDLFSKILINKLINKYCISYISYFFSLNDANNVSISNMIDIHNDNIGFTLFNIAKNSKLNIRNLIMYNVSVISQFLYIDSKYNKIVLDQIIIQNATLKKFLIGIYFSSDIKILNFLISNLIMNNSNSFLKFYLNNYCFCKNFILKSSYINFKNPFIYSVHGKNNFTFLNSLILLPKINTNFFFNLNSKISLKIINLILHVNSSNIFKIEISNTLTLIYFSLKLSVKVQNSTLINIIEKNNSIMIKQGQILNLEGQNNLIISSNKSEIVGVLELIKIKDISSELIKIHANNNKWKFMNILIIRLIATKSLIFFLNSNNLVIINFFGQFFSTRSNIIYMNFDNIINITSMKILNNLTKNGIFLNFNEKYNKCNLSYIFITKIETFISSKISCEIRAKYFKGLNFNLIKGSVANLGINNTLILNNSDLYNFSSQTIGNIFILNYKNSIKIFQLKIFMLKSNSNCFLYALSNNTMIFKYIFLNNVQEKQSLFILVNLNNLNLYYGNFREIEGGLLDIADKGNINISFLYIKNIFAKGNDILAENFIKIESNFYLKIENLFLNIMTIMKGGLFFFNSNNEIILSKIIFMNLTIFNGFLGKFYGRNIINIYLFRILDILVKKIDERSLFMYKAYCDSQMKYFLLINLRIGIFNKDSIFQIQNSNNLKINFIKIVSKNKNSLQFLWSDLNNKIELNKIKILKTIEVCEEINIMFLSNYKNSFLLKNAIFINLIKFSSIFNCTFSNSFFNLKNQTDFKIHNLNFADKFLSGENNSIKINSFLFLNINSKIDIKNLNINLKKCYFDNFLNILGNSKINLTISKISIISKIFLLLNFQSNAYMKENTNINMIEYSFSSYFLFIDKESKILIFNTSFRHKNVQKFIFTENSNIMIKKTVIMKFKNNDSNAIFHSINSDIYLFANIFLFNFNYGNGAIAFINSSSEKVKIFIYHNVFSSNQAKKGLIHIYQKQKTLNFFIFKNILISNKGISGGAIFIELFNKLIIQQNKFFHNFGNKGGCISIFREDNSQQLKFSLNIYKHNKAQVGGVFYFQNFYQLKNIKFIKETYVQNSAYFYGIFKATGVIKKILYISEFDKFDYYIKKKKIYFSSSVTYEKCLLKFGMVDEFMNKKLGKYNDFNNFTLNISENSANINLKIEYFFKNFEFFNFKFIKIDSFLCLKGQIFLKKLPIDLEQKYFISFSGIKIFEFQLISTHCSIGQKIHKYETTKLYHCNDCQKLWYSFKRIVKNPHHECKKCTILNPFFCYGGFRLKRKINYWRLNKVSTNFILCKNDKICLGEIKLKDNYEDEFLRLVSFCSFPNKGAICQECYEDFGLDEKFFCLKCEEKYFGKIIKIIITTLLRTGIFIFSIKNSIEKSYMIKKKNINLSVIISQYLTKIITDHMLILQILTNFPLGYENLGLTLIEGFDFASPQMSKSFSFECFMFSFNFKKSIIYFKLLVSIIYPILVFIISFFFFQNRKFYPDKKNKTIFEKISKIWITQNILIIIFILCMPDIFQSSLELFSCLNIGDEFIKDERMSSDIKIRCYSRENKLWENFVSFPSIIIFVFIPTLSILFSLTYYRKIRMSKNLKEEKYNFVYGFLINSYKKSFFYWDFIILLKKFLIVLISIFLYNKVQTRSNQPLFLISLILIIFLCLDVKIKPFDETFKILNSVLIYSGLTLVLTYGSIFYLLGLCEKNKFLNSIIFAIILIANGLFVLYIFGLYFKKLIEKKIKKNKQNLCVNCKIMRKEIKRMKDKKNNYKIKFKILEKEINQNQKDKKKSKISLISNNFNLNTTKKSNFFAFPNKETNIEQIEKIKNPNESNLINKRFILFLNYKF